jgi:hypothetical protein
LSRSRWVVIVVLLVAIAGIWLARRRPANYSNAYVADRSLTVWNSTAQVRRPLADLGFGQRVAVLRRAGDQAEVETQAGLKGWVDARLLMDSVLWQRVNDLLVRARGMPPQATGHTRTLSNVHLEPGRESSRIFQFGRNVPVTVIERRVAALASHGGTDGRTNASDTAEPAEKKNDVEDWLLVLRTAEPATSPAQSAKVEDEPVVPIAGWVLSRFIDLDPPQPIGDYASSMPGRVIAWAELNRVADGEKPQYVVAGTRGPEGQPCDFTWIRVYTWGAERRRYETAYIENDLCGHLPVRVRQTPTGTEFQFADQISGARTYRLAQTIVRRVNQAGPSRGKNK